MGYTNVAQVAVAGGGTTKEQSTPYQDPMDVQKDAIECAGIVLVDENNRDQNVTLIRNGNDLVFKDCNVPLTTFSQVVNGIDYQSGYTEFTRTSGKISSVTMYTDSSKTTKVKEWVISRTNGQISSVVEKMYNASGVQSSSVTSAITRSNNQASSITRTLSS